MGDKPQAGSPGYYDNHFREPKPVARRYDGSGLYRAYDATGRIIAQGDRTFCNERAGAAGPNAAAYVKPVNPGDL